MRLFNNLVQGLDHRRLQIINVNPDFCNQVTTIQNVSSPQLSSTSSGSVIIVSTLPLIVFFSISRAELTCYRHMGNQYSSTAGLDGTERGRVGLPYGLSCPEALQPFGHRRIAQARFSFCHLLYVGIFGSCYPCLPC